MGRTKTHRKERLHENRTFEVSYWSNIKVRKCSWIEKFLRDSLSQCHSILETTIDRTDVNVFNCLHVTRLLCNGQKEISALNLNLKKICFRSCHPATTGKCAKLRSKPYSVNLSFWMCSYLGEKNKIIIQHFLIK